VVAETELARAQPNGAAELACVSRGGRAGACGAARDDWAEEGSGAPPSPPPPPVRHPCSS